MIGNDIVDLSLAKSESNWKRKGYLDKIFTKREHKFILTHENPDIMIWNLWSRKEAVYKIIIQKGGKRGYYPIKIECQNTDLENGFVVFENQIYHTKTIVSHDFIYSEAVENSLDFDKIIEISNMDNVIKIEEIPFYIIDNQLFFASKTHHGKYEKVVYLNKINSKVYRLPQELLVP